MFIQVLFPIADCRRFSPAAAQRLPRPTWPDPVPDSHFVRTFGGIKKRRKGGVNEWAGERFFCLSDNAVRFSPGGNGKYFRLNGRETKTFNCQDRRLFTDGQVTTRVEVLFSNESIRENFYKFGLPIVEGERPLSELECRALLDEVLKTTVRVRARTLRFKTSTLALAGPLLASHYLDATTPTAEPRDAASVLAGRPLVVIEHEAGEVERLSGRRVVKSLAAANIRLSYLDFPPVAGVWFIEVQGGTEFDKLRRLRIHLGRLHQERECLRVILRAISERKLAFDRDSDTLERFQDYVYLAEKMLRRKTWDTLPQADLLNAAYDADELVDEGASADLMSALDTVRRSLKRKVSALIRQPQTVVYGRAAFVSGGYADMSDNYSAGQAAAMGPGAQAHGNTFQQIWQQNAGTIDLPALAKELATLRQGMKNSAESTEEFIALGEIAAAERDANAGNGPGVLEHLKKGGTWAFDVATKIGTSVAAEVIKKSLGL